MVHLAALVVAALALSGATAGATATDTAPAVDAPDANDSPPAASDDQDDGEDDGEDEGERAAEQPRDADAPAPADGPAHLPADVPEVREHVDAPPPRTWAMLRGGLSNDPTILHACAEVIPIDGTLSLAGRAWHTGLSVEGCGNGSGFLFRSPAPEIAHFRAKWKLWAFDTAYGWFEPIVSGGFAELQTGADAPGFTFGGVAPGGNSTAGPEAGTSLRYKLPLGLGFELLGEAGVSVAYFAYARELNTPADPFQTSLVVTAGLGW